MALHLHVEAHQLEDNRQCVLEINLHLSHHLVVAVGKQCLQTGHEAFDIAVSDIPNEIIDGKRPVHSARKIVGAKELGKTPFHLLIRESETVTFELFVKVLDGQIAALEQQRNRVVVHHIHTIHRAHIHFFGSEPV